MPCTSASSILDPPGRAAFGTTTLVAFVSRLRRRSNGAICVFFRQIAAAAIAAFCVAGPAVAAENNALGRAEALRQQVDKLYEEGRYADAIPLAKEVLAIREEALGPDHLDVATSLNNLAGLYQQQGRYAEAEPLYKRSLTIREKARGPDHPDLATTLNNLALLYNDQGRYAEAEPLFKRSLVIDEKVFGPDHPVVAADLNNLAGLYLEQGRYAAAEPLLKRSLAIREKALGPDHPDLATTLNNLALLYYHQGRYAEAEPLFKRSLAIREKALGPDHPDVAQSLGAMAELYRSQGRDAEAEPLFKRSLAIREKALGPDHPDVANSLNNLALLYDHQGRYAEVGQLYKRSLTILEKALGPKHPNVAKSLNNLAELYRSQGRNAEAEALFRRSLAIDEKALGPNHLDVALNLGNLAGLYYRERRYAEAINLSRRAVAIVAKRTAGTDVQSASGREAEQRTGRAYFLDNVAIVNAVGGPTAAAESFRVAQLASASAAAQAVAGMAARFAAGNDAMAAAVRQRQDLADRWQALDKAIVAAASRPPKQRDPAAEDALRTELGKVNTALDALDARIAHDFPGYAELSNPKPLELADAQALLAPDEAMLVYLVGDDATWLWALRRDRAAFYKLDIGADALAAEVTALRGRLDPARNPDLAPFDAQRANALYQKIVAPAASVLDGAHAVFIVPDRALQSLPFGVLVTKPPAANPQHPADHRDIAWLMRDYALTVLPSVGSLRALRQFTAAGHGSLPFVGIGNPVLKGKPAGERGVKLADLFRGRVADVAEVRMLPPLPETAEELRAVAKDLGAGDKDLYLGERASEPLLRQAGLDRYRIVEFATHGLLSGDLPGLAEPALVLTPPQEASPDNDGLLTASKIATLKLDADWVVLSACNTAAADGAPDAEGLSGLAKAFFYAGARSILVSHWSVVSKATVKLITDAFAELQKNPEIGRAEALHRAELAMLDPNNPPEFAHPLVWAPFILAGEGGAGR
jgi:CHAT domain-containing protein/Tfp pilus assembly protein PilF